MNSGPTSNTKNETKELQEDIKEITNIFRRDVLKHLVVIIGSHNQKNVMNLIKTCLNYQTNKDKKNKYLALIAEDISALKGETPRQKLHMILSMANFVIADDSVPSGELIELEYCRNVGAITGILRKKGIPSSWMVSDVDLHSPDFKVEEYDEPTYKTISEKVNKIIKWAEERKQHLSKEFNKRTRSN